MTTEKIISYIETEYSYVERLIKSDSPLAHRYGKDVISNALTRCYGVVQFASNELFDSYNTELVDWWDCKMKPRFNELRKEVK